MAANQQAGDIVDDEQREDNAEQGMPAPRTSSSAAASGVTQLFLDDFMESVLPIFGLDKQALSTPTTQEEWKKRLQGLQSNADGTSSGKTTEKTQNEHDSSIEIPQHFFDRGVLKKLPTNDENVRLISSATVRETDKKDELIEIVSFGLKMLRSDLEEARKLVLVPRVRKSPKEWVLVEAEVKNLNDDLPTDVSPETQLSVRVKDPSPPPSNSSWLQLSAQDLAMVKTSDIVDMVIKTTTKYGKDNKLIEERKRKTFCDHLKDVHPNGKEWVEKHYVGIANEFVSHAWMDSWLDFSSALTGGSSIHSESYTRNRASQVAAYVPFAPRFRQWFEREQKRVANKQRDGTTKTDTLSEKQRENEEESGQSKMTWLFSTWPLRLIAWHRIAAGLFRLFWIFPIEVFVKSALLVRIFLFMLPSKSVNKLSRKFHHISGHIHYNCMWIDIFCKNQWIVNGEDTEKELEKSVANMDTLRLVCHSWYAPNALFRIWCQFELRAARKSNTRIVGVMCDEQAAAFKQACSNIWRESMLWYVSFSSCIMLPHLLAFTAWIVCFFEWQLPFYSNVFVSSDIERRYMVSKRFHDAKSIFLMGPGQRYRMDIPNTFAAGEQNALSVHGEGWPIEIASILYKLSYLIFTLMLGVGIFIFIWSRVRIKNTHENKVSDENGDKDKNKKPIALFKLLEKTVRNIDARDAAARFEEDRIKILNMICEVEEEKKEESSDKQSYDDDNQNEVRIPQNQFRGRSMDRHNEHMRRVYIGLMERKLSDNSSTILTPINVVSLVFWIAILASEWAKDRFELILASDLKLHVGRSEEKISQIESGSGINRHIYSIYERENLGTSIGVSIIFNTICVFLMVISCLLQIHRKINLCFISPLKRIKQYDVTDEGKQSWLKLWRGRGSKVTTGALSYSLGPTGALAFDFLVSFLCSIIGVLLIIYSHEWIAACSGGYYNQADSICPRPAYIEPPDLDTPSCTFSLRPEYSLHHDPKAFTDFRHDGDGCSEDEYDYTRMPDGARYPRDALEHILGTYYLIKPKGKHCHWSINSGNLVCSYNRLQSHSGSVLAYYEETLKSWKSDRDYPHDGPWSPVDKPVFMKYYRHLNDPWVDFPWYLGGKYWCKWHDRYLFFDETSGKWVVGYAHLPDWRQYIANKNRLTFQQKSWVFSKTINASDPSKLPLDETWFVFANKTNASSSDTLHIITAGSQSSSTSTYFDNGVFVGAIQLSCKNMT